MKRNRLLRIRRKRQRASALLHVERLERRIVLATVTATDPTANAHDASVSTNVEATFDEVINGGSATDQTFRVSSPMRSGTVTVSAAGMTVTADPSSHFFPNELVQVTATNGIQGASTAVVPEVWQFRTAANSGSGLFVDSGQTIGVPADNVSSQGVELGDLDGDGDLDAFVVNDNVANRVYINDGGNFTDSGQTLASNASREVALGDLDGDGDLDAVVANDGGQGNIVWQNAGNGTFAQAQSFGNSDSEGLQLADLDADGDLDVFVANMGQPDRVWLNNGGSLSDSGQSLGTHASEAVELGDLDGDGDLDAYVVNTQYQGNRIWLNNGNGTFAASDQTLGGHASRSVDLGDLDGDGDLDAFVANRDQDNRVWINDGNGVFTDTGQLLVRAGTGLGNRYSRTDWVELGDLDADGDLDAFTVNDNGGPNRIWLNDGAAVFVDSGQDLWLVPGGSFLNNPASRGAALGDVDGNGTLDAFVANDAAGDGTPSVSRLWLNRSLTPNVTLSIDNATLAEADGTATITATLSASHTQDVTVDLETSGSATVDDDYSLSATQIVVSAGATSASVVLTTVSDEADEEDENVVIAIAAVTNGNEVGEQEVNAVILDDDEPVVPDVTLAVDNTTIPEESGSATVTASLSEVTTVDVTVSLSLSGSATLTDDYTASTTEIVISAGDSSGFMTITAVQDEIDEPDESVLIAINTVDGGNEDGIQQAAIQIIDDDTPPGLLVTALGPTSSGFIAQFNNELDVADLNLYDTQAAGAGEADAMLVGDTSGPVIGSLVVGGDGRSVQFIKSGGPLEPDNYTVTLRSAADGFEDIGGLLLDGNGDGTGGDDFSSSFTVDEPAANQITIGIPDVVRGPGQDVNLPADSEAGIPLTISNGDNVRAIDLRISYDPELLTITGATAGPDAPGATPVLNTNTPGLAVLVFFSSNSLPAGEGNFVNLTATIPRDNASEIYRDQQILDISDVVVSDGNDNEFPVTVDDALHVTTFFADVSGNGRINAADAAGVARIAALIDSGFGTMLSTDPGVLGDISGNGRLNAADASLVAQFAALIPVPQIPAVPGGVSITGVLNPGEDTTEDRGGSQEDLLDAVSDDSTFRVVDNFVSQSAGSVDLEAVDSVVAEGDDFLGDLWDGLL